MKRKRPRQPRTTVVDTSGFGIQVRKIGWRDRIECDALGLSERSPGVYHVGIFHDSWCAQLRGGDCNCSPNIEEITSTEATVLEANKRMRGQS